MKVSKKIQKIMRQNAEYSKQYIDYDYSSFGENVVNFRKIRISKEPVKKRIDMFINNFV